MWKCLLQASMRLGFDKLNVWNISRFCVSVHSLHFSFSVAFFHFRTRFCTRSISSCLFSQRLTIGAAAKKAIHNNRWCEIFKILWTVLKKSNKIENHTAVHFTWQQTGKTSMFEMLWQMKTIHQIRSNHTPCLSFFTYFSWHKSEKSKETLCNSKVFGKILLYEENKQRNVSC